LAIAGMLPMARFRKATDGSTDSTSRNSICRSSVSPNELDGAAFDAAPLAQHLLARSLLSGATGSSELTGSQSTELVV
jgi:hypothetical protein